MKTAAATETTNGGPDGSAVNRGDAASGNGMIEGGDAATRIAQLEALLEMSNQEKTASEDQVTLLVRNNRELRDILEPLQDKVHEYEKRIIKQAGNEADLIGYANLRDVNKRDKEALIKLQEEALRDKEESDKRINELVEKIRAIEEERKSRDKHIASFIINHQGDLRITKSREQAESRKAIQLAHGVNTIEKKGVPVVDGTKGLPAQTGAVAPSKTVSTPSTLAKAGLKPETRKRDASDIASTSALATPQVTVVAPKKRAEPADNGSRVG